ncbi:hypothetical protein CDEST_10452 [Colletotrichum destructivum]|uniref:Uncharacterized protein n=1 Tax=Colletotrichum destructivum TaxID=34406 RepID=A0AAX4IQJ4_9PEZI|nr:hypothetical protein CDEST_10452 [Colletotrichum destructivum]
MFLGPGGSPKSPKAKACPRQILSRPKGHTFTPPSFFQGVQPARETFTDPGGAVRYAKSTKTTLGAVADNA